MELYHHVFRSLTAPMVLLVLLLIVSKTLAFPQSSDAKTVAPESTTTSTTTTTTTATTTTATTTTATTTTATTTTDSDGPSPADTFNDALSPVKEWAHEWFSNHTVGDIVEDASDATSSAVKYVKNLTVFGYIKKNIWKPATDELASIYDGIKDQTPAELVGVSENEADKETAEE